MPARIGKAVLYLFLSYWIVSLLAILLTILFAEWFKPPSPQESGVKASQASAYLMTIPYHLIPNLLIWPFFASFYLHGIPFTQRQGEAWRLETFWAAITIVLNLIGWVIVQHPWANAFEHLYMGYQPWITPVFLVIFGSPIAALAYLKVRTSLETHSFRVNDEDSLQNDFVRLVSHDFPVRSLSPGSNPPLEMVGAH
jgi:hypothetical protein